MRRSAVALSLTAAVSVGVSAQAERVEIRVRVKKELLTVEVSGMGLRVSPPSAFRPVTALVDTDLAKAKITRKSHGQWVVDWFDDKGLQRFECDRLSVRGQILRVGAEPVPYDLEVVPNPKKGLDVIARLDLETYLAGVLPAEMPVSWPLEALKAQTVAARSFVLKSAIERREQAFDVDSTIIDQVYRFLSEADTDAVVKRRLNRAINETRGQILRDEHGRILKAFYSADCGCQSEDPRFVWGKLDSFISVKDPTCSKRKPLTWEVAVDRVDVRGRLVGILGLPVDSQFRAMHVAGRTPSGRVAEVVAVMAVGGKSQSYRLSANEFRKAFGFQRLRSTDFSLQWFADELHIRGNGAGHGVGLCQTGARGFAEEGRSFKEILKFYYPKAKLSSIRAVAG
jgi:stage II sporulation protein D